ncbi:MAG: EAL domain-containing protein [Telmatospirillum sp.]|nr:EAL domain-containing protein [Telmatospirillum sp.]
MGRLDSLLSRIGVQARTVSGFAILLLMMAGLAMFSLSQLSEIGDGVRALVALDKADAAIADVDSHLARLNSLVHSFMRTRRANDIAATQTESQALTRKVESVLAAFADDPLLRPRQDRIRAGLARHAHALNAAAAASRRHQSAVDRFLASSIPIATTVYAMGMNTSGVDPGGIAQSKMQLQARFFSSRAAVTRYIVTLQPADGESALEEMGKFAAAVEAQKPTGQRRFDKFVAYIREKLPAYEGEANAVVLAVGAEAEAEAEINLATGDLDRIADELKESFARLRADHTSSQLADLTTLYRLLLTVTALTILIGVALAWMIGISIARPIVRMTGAMNQLAAGNLDVEVPAQDHQDEIGRMAAATEVFKRNALALRASETRYRELLENLMEGVYQTSPDGHLLSANQATADMLGWPTPEELLADVSDVAKDLYADPSQRAPLLEEIRDQGFVRGYEITLRHRDGREIVALISTRGIVENGTLVRLEGAVIDITALKEADREIRKLAFYDPLPRLPNRRLLLDRLGQALAAHARTGREGALLFIDLDNFKTLNDTFGHAKGDILLQQVTERLVACVRAGDTVARLGGDEFVVMLEDLSGNAREAAHQVEAVGDKILTALNHPYMLGGQAHHGSASIGATLFGDPRNSIDDLLKQADIAMYQAKAAGRNTLRFFDADLQASVTARASLEADLRLGMSDGQFSLFYQPQVDGAGRLIGAEALLRWRHPVRGMVSPAEFIPLAEETGLILPLGSWVLETACRQIAEWAGSPDTAGLSLAVNVSARQFDQPDFVGRVLAVVDRTGIDPRRLKLELTESMVPDNIQDIIDKMSSLIDRGVSFSLDDFGTGYSSLSYLKRLPLSQLKIDQSFVRHVLTDRNDAAIARTIVALSQCLGLTVIAEGVETEEQRAFFAGLGCHGYQGYLFSRPLPMEDFRRLFDHRTAVGRSHLPVLGEPGTVLSEW